MAEKQFFAISRAGTRHTRNVRLGCVRQQNVGDIGRSNGGRDDAAVETVVEKP